MEFSPEQWQAIEHEGSAVVLAGAGSGKTRVIVEWYVRTLVERFSDADIESVVAVTFTEKAAGELKSRIRDRMRRYEREATTNSASRRAATLAAFLSLAPIGTIHSLCARLLRRYWAESGTDPEFVILDPLEQQRLLDQASELALAEWGAGTSRQRASLATLLAAFGRPHKLRRVVADMLRRRSEFLSPARHYLARTSSELARDFLSSDQPALVYFAREVETLDLHATKLLYTRWKDSSAKVRELLGAIEQYLAAAPNSKAKLESAMRWIGLLAGDGTDCDPDLKAAYSKPRELWPKRVADAAARLMLFCPGQEQSLEADFEFLRRLSELFGTAADCYRRLCDGRINALRRDLLDFSELEIRLEQLLTNQEQVRSDIRQHLRALIVDEYQDTSEIQWRIFQLLTGIGEESGAEQGPPCRLPWLYVVGDPNQAIYGWRQAGRDVFERTIAAVQKGPAAGAPGGRIFRLRTNFRTQKQLVESLNPFWKRLLDTPDWAEGHEPRGYRENEGGAVVWLHTVSPAQREGNNARPSAAASAPLSEQAPGADNEQDIDRVDALALTVAELIPRLVAWSRATGASATPASAAAPLDLGDVAILCRKRRLFTPLEMALRRADIPFLTHGGSGFYAQPEIVDLVNILRVVATPEDDFALLGMLRGGAVRCPDETLWKISHIEGRTFFERCRRAVAISAEPASLVLQPEERSRIEFALDLVERLQRRLAVTPVDVLLDRIVEWSGMWGAVGFRGRGERARANIRKLTSVAQKFRHASLAQFVEFLEEQEQAEDLESEAVMLHEGARAVNIMTVHAAKGLEFRAVILPYLEDPLNLRTGALLSDACRWFTSRENMDPERTTSAVYLYLSEVEQSRQLEEEKRVLYVAMTRARDYLVLCTREPKREIETSVKAWLEKFLSPASVARGWSEAEALLGQKRACPIYRLEIEAPEDLQPSPPPPRQSETSQEERFRDYAGRAAWLAEPFLREREEFPWQDYDWGALAPRPLVVNRPLTVGTSEFLTYLLCPKAYFENYVLEIAAPTGAESDIDEERQRERDGASIEARQWGILFHAVIEELLGRGADSHEAIQQAVADHVSRLKEPLGSDQRERLQGELIETLMSALHAAAFDELRAAYPRLWFERPYLAAVDENFFLSGTIDCEYTTAEGLVAIADFKTGRHDAGNPPELYIQQMRTYLWMIWKRYPSQQLYRATLLFARNGASAKSVVMSAADLREFEQDLRRHALAFRQFLARYVYGDSVVSHELARRLADACRSREKPCPIHAPMDYHRFQ